MSTPDMPKDAPVAPEVKQDETKPKKDKRMAALWVAVILAFIPTFFPVAFLIGQRYKKNLHTWIGRALAVMATSFLLFGTDANESWIDENWATVTASVILFVAIVHALVKGNNDKPMKVLYGILSVMTFLGIFASMVYTQIAVAILVGIFFVNHRRISLQRKAEQQQMQDVNGEQEQQFGTGLMSAISLVVGTQWTEFQRRYPQFTDFAGFKAHIDGLLAQKDRLLKEKDAQIAALIQQLGQRGPVQPTDETSQFGPVDEFGPVPAQPQDDNRTQVLRPLRPRGPVQPLDGDDRPYQGPATTEYRGDTTYGGQQPYPQAPVHGDPSLRRPSEGPHQD